MSYQQLYQCALPWWEVSWIPVYINDLPAVVKNSEAPLYADDTVLYCYSKESQLLKNKLNEELFNVANWLKEDKLTLHLEKTKSMIIENVRKLVNISSISLFF